MFLTAHVRLADLAGLSRRLATSIESGIELRRVLDREAHGRTHGALRRRLDAISDQVQRGTSLAEAIEQTGSFFPPLFREMVAVGEQSGHLPEVLDHLADHYEHQLRLRRDFLSGITWPMIELSAAVAIVGLLIWLTGVIGEVTGQTVDILGLGLVGTQGLVIYLGCVLAAALVATFTWQAVARGLFWAFPVQWLLMQTPVIGRILETLAMARLAWSLNLVGNTEMPLTKALPLCLRATHNAYYSRFAEEISRDVRRGQTLTETLGTTGVFPPEFLDSLDVGERSGRMPETMALLAEQYRDQARRALATLNVVAGFLVWLAVASLIVMVIFRIFSFYVGMLNEAMRP
jgi:type II secretory pathway component PulF